MGLLRPAPVVTCDIPGSFEMASIRLVELCCISRSCDMAAIGTGLSRIIVLVDAPDMMTSSSICDEFSITKSCVVVSRIVILLINVLCEM